MAEQPFAGPAPAPALVFAERESSELLKQLYGRNEDFVEVSYIPPSLAGAFAGGYKDNEGKIVFPRSMIANVALLAIQIPANNISIITKSPTLATINEAFAKVGKYRHTPIKSLGQFLKEVPQMIRRMPALKADLHSIQVNFEEVSIANSLNDREAKNCGLSGDSSLISTDNRSFTLNALVDQDTGCVHSNGVLLLLSFPGLRQLNLARGSVDLATLMSVKALVERATKNMPFSPDVPAESQVQFLRSVMDAKLSVEWADVINWRTEKSQIQHAIAFKVFGETDERLRLYADMLDLRRVLNREEYADMAMMLTELGCTTPHNDPPLTILATFTVPAPISVAVRLRRVWYRSAAPIVASKGLHLSSVPKVVDVFMSPRTPRTSNRSLATLRRPLRYAKMNVASPGRTRIAAARRAASAHARREFVRTKVGIRL